jgi:hypothetical protein
LFGFNDEEGDKAMIRRTTWIILSIFIILLGILIYFQFFNEKSSNLAPTPTISPPLLSGLTEDLINLVNIDDIQGNVLEVSRNSSGEWVLTKPLAEVTDQSRVDDTIQQILSLAPILMIEPAPDTSATGLDFPAYLIIIQTTNGKQFVIRIGKETAIQNGYYLRVDQGPVYVVNKFNLENLLGILSSPPILVTPTPEVTETLGSTPGLETESPSETQTPGSVNGNP